MKHGSSFHEFKEKIKKYSEESANDDSEWIESVKDTLAALDARPWRNLSIYTVPKQLRKLDEDAYSPTVVSIGPFHHRNQSLRAMEEHKWRYMLHLLHRTNDAIAAFEKCAPALQELEQSARLCYAQHIDFKKQELMEIFLVDGCFVLELFIRFSEKKSSGAEPPSWIKSDPLINNQWGVPTLQHDLALLENQIPFEVLQKLFDVIAGDARQLLQHSLTEYALNFFQSALHLSNEGVKKKSSPDGKHLHLLDLLHEVYRPATTREKAGNDAIKEWGFRASATKLVKAGIRFEIVNSDNPNSENPLDVNFEEGVVTIPKISILKPTQAIFKNLIAFEQCNFGGSNYVASYALLMHSLLRSPQDIRLLQKKKIIADESRDWVGEELADFFKSAQREVVFTDFYYSDISEEVNRYRRSWLQWRRIKAFVMVRCHEYAIMLMGDYFGNPWSITSFIAAVVLLVLTALQTYYTVRSYYHQ